MPLDSEGRKHVKRLGYFCAIWTLVSFFMENGKTTGGLWVRLWCSLHGPCLCMLCMCSHQANKRNSS